jgi:Prokaryotic membrane lipoprotein lipid attachment site
MKKLIFLFLIMAFVAACNSNTGNAPAEEKSAGPALTMPFTPTYSTDFVLGSDSNSLATLNSYKAWRDGDMAALRKTLGDSVKFDFASGYTFNGSLDSFMTMASKVRDSLSKVDLNIDVWLPTHFNDKNADWVSVWYTEIDTYKSGKVDSTYFEDDNLLKNGKIVYVDSKMRKLK